MILQVSNLCHPNVTFQRPAVLDKVIRKVHSLHNFDTSTGDGLVFPRISGPWRKVPSKFVSKYINWDNLRWTWMKLILEGSPEGNNFWNELSCQVAIEIWIWCSSPKNRTRPCYLDDLWGYLEVNTMITGIYKRYICLDAGKVVTVVTWIYIYIHIYIFCIYYE